MNINNFSPIKWNPNKGSPFYYYFLLGFIHVFTGIVMIVSLGFYSPMWSANSYGWLIKKRCKYWKSIKSKGNTK